MNEDKLKMKNEPAFPNLMFFPETEEQKMEQKEGKTEINISRHYAQVEAPCMSKRFYAACMAMQGIVSASHPDNVGILKKGIVEKAYAIADELLEQENKGV